MGFFDAIWTGIDDAICGWGELFTHSRQSKVEAAHRRFGFLVDDIKALEATLKMTCDTHQEVIGALAAQANELNQYLGYDPKGPEIDLLQVTHTVSSLISGTSQIAGTVWLVSTLVSRLATVAMIAGKVFVVTAVITTVLQTIMQGVEVARLREEAQRIENEIAKLKGLLSDMANEVAGVTQDLQATYNPLVPLEAGRHVVIDAADGLKRLELETFYDRLQRLLVLAQEQDSEDRTAFTAMREQIEQDNQFIHAHLIAAINRNSVAQGVASGALLKAVAALRSGMPLEQAQEIFELAPHVLETVADFIKTHPLQQPRFMFSGDGQIENVPA